MMAAHYEKPTTFKPQGSRLTQTEQYGLLSKQRWVALGKLPRAGFPKSVCVPNPSEKTASEPPQS